MPNISQVRASRALAALMGVTMTLSACVGHSDSIGASRTNSIGTSGAGMWTATGSLITGRQGHTATLLPTGRVLVAGGYRYSHVLTTAELYDPHTGRWTATGSMSTGRQGHTATLLPTGRVLVAGGCCDTYGDALTTAELYDPRTGRWMPTGSMHTPASEATLLPNGDVLTIGSFYTCRLPPPPSGCPTAPSAELYDSRSGLWRPTGSMNNIESTLTLLRTGQVLAAEGYGVSDYHMLAQLYDPRRDRWTGVGSQTVSANGPATLLPNGQVFFVGMGTGNVSIVPQGIATAALYDPRSRTWTTTRTAGVGAQWDANTTTATLLSTGQVLVVGGSDIPSLYDPGSRTWMATGRMRIGRGNHTATLLPTGQVLVAGGCCGPANQVFTDAELYTPVTLMVSPTSSIVARTVTVTGTGFGTSGRVQLYWARIGAPPLMSVTTATDGSFSARVTIPQATYGMHVIVALGPTSALSATATVQVRPWLRLIPALGQQGTTTSAIGFGFGAQEAVTLHWDTPTGRRLGTSTSNPRGRFVRASMRVPQGRRGQHSIYAVGQHSHARAVATFMVP